MAIAGNQDSIVARNTSPPSMSKVFQLCQVALGHIDLIGKEKEETQTAVYSRDGPTPKTYQRAPAIVQQHQRAPLHAAPKQDEPRALLRYNTETDLHHARVEQGKRQRPYFARGRHWGLL